MAIAPRAIASLTNLLPSAFCPGRAKNNAPSLTFRLSHATEEILGFAVPLARTCSIPFNNSCKLNSRPLGASGLPPEFTSVACSITNLNLRSLAHLWTAHRPPYGQSARPPCFPLPLARPARATVLAQLRCQSATAPSPAENILPSRCERSAPPSPEPRPRPRR